MASAEPKINVDGVEYLLSDLSDDAKAQIRSLQFVESEIGRLQAQIAIANTAKIAYQNALKSLLPQQSH
jgi:hypothetical protein